MNYTLMACIASFALFITIVAISRFAYRIGRGRPDLVETSSESAGAVVGAVFALLGLLTAFTFSAAYSRLETRRQLMVQEVNAIGTAYLRLDVLPNEAQAQLRKDFKAYTLSRFAFYQKLTEKEGALSELAHASELQQLIWSKAVSASSGTENSSIRMLLLPALNEMIDIVTTRSVAIMAHPPLLIYASLALISIACGGMIGYRASISEYSSRFYEIAFALVMSFTMYLILDIEYPRFGLVRLDHINQLLFDLANTMK